MVLKYGKKYMNSLRQNQQTDHKLKAYTLIKE